MKSSIITIALVVSLAIAGTATAQKGPRADMRGPHADQQWGPGGPGCGPGMEGHGMWKGLGLTEDQEKQIGKLKVEHQKQMLGLNTEMQGLRSTMKQLIVADKFDSKAVSRNASEISEVAKQIAESKANHMRNVRDMLTEDQRIKFDQKVLSGHGGPKGKGPRGGGPGHGRGRG